MQCCQLAKCQCKGSLRPFLGHYKKELGVLCRFPRQGSRSIP